MIPRELVLQASTSGAEQGSTCTAPEDLRKQLPIRILMLRGSTPAVGECTGKFMKCSGLSSHGLESRHI